MGQPSLQEFQAGLARLLVKAQRDAAFNSRCRQDPAQAFREVAGMEVPDGCTLRCMDVDEGEILIPLPEGSLVHVGQDLSDSQLDAVAGGTGEDFEFDMEFLGRYAEDIKGQAEVTTMVDAVRAAPAEVATGLGKAGTAFVGAAATVTTAVGGWFASQNWRW